LLPNYQRACEKGLVRGAIGCVDDANDPFVLNLLTFERQHGDVSASLRHFKAVAEPLAAE
jgi:hypothetical protein